MLSVRHITRSGQPSTCQRRPGGHGGHAPFPAMPRQPIRHTRPARPRTVKPRRRVKAVPQLVPQGRRPTIVSEACERASETRLGEPLLAPPHSGSASSCTRPTMARRIALLSIRLNALMSLSPSWLETKSLMYCIGNAEVTCLSAAPSKKNGISTPRTPAACCKRLELILFMPFSYFCTC